MKRQILFLVIPGVAIAASDLHARDGAVSRHAGGGAADAPSLVRRIQVAQDGAGAPGPMLRRRVVRQGDGDGAGDGPAGERRIERRVKVIAGPGGADHALGFSWVGEALGGKPMKGAPFSATAVTEMEQPLADGNRIRQKTSAALARDSAGRTRREVALGAIGPLVATGNPHKLIHLHDPATDTSTTLDPERKTAFRGGKGDPAQLRHKFQIALPPPAGAAAPGSAAPGPQIEEDFVFEAPMRGPMGAMGLGGGPGMAIQILDALPPDAPKPVREELGTQTIEGVRAQGQRTTVTIPAGKIGNERPLVTVSERWYSPDLGVVVMTRHSDPRFGTTTYRLTDIDRREPPAAQFEVPSDYKLEEGPILIRRRLLQNDKPEK